MIQVLKDKYFSKADTYILPLTGLPKSTHYSPKSYLFWEDYSIEDLQLIVVYSYVNKHEFINYCRKYIFPVLDRKCYLMESYDFEGKTVFVLDMSEWSMDIIQFLNGKYSKLSKEAKDRIESFHIYYVKDEPITPVHIYSTLYPSKVIDKEKGEPLGKMTPIEYVAKNWELNLPLLQQVGELGSIYDIKEETLTIRQEADTNLEAV